jgi:hypothetical protein
MKAKKGQILNSVVVHLILIGIIFALFFLANADKINQRGVKQQVIEKEISLLIESGVPGMSFEIKKINFNGNISRIEIKEGKVFATVAGFRSASGYPYFSPYSISVIEEEDKFVVKLDE